MVIVLMLAITGSSAAQHASAQGSAETWKDGVRYYQQGISALQRDDPAQAAIFLKRALDIARIRLPKNSNGTAVMLYSLGQVYTLQGRLRDAEILLREAIEILEGYHGKEERISLYIALNELGNVYLRQQRLSEAEPLFKRAIEIASNVSGKDHPDVVMVLTNLASVFEQTGRVSDAIKLYTRSLAIIEVKQGKNSLNFANALRHLAWLLTATNKFVEAESFYRQSLAIYEARLGKYHLEVSNALHDLATLYDLQGRYDAAQNLYQRALTIQEEKLGKSHVNVANTLNSMANIYLAQGLYSDATSILERSLKITEAFLGRYHPLVIRTRNNLIEGYNGKHEYLSSLLQIEQLTSIRKGQARRVLPGLYGAQNQKLITAPRAFADAYKTLQYNASSPVATAIKKVAVRDAAGTSELAKFVRQLQDLTTEKNTADEALITEISKPLKQRNDSLEHNLRRRLDEIEAQRSSIAAELEQKFPNYVALSNPQPLTLEETQGS
jgi:tetratricopeptide (TPR) repeat protein